MKNVWKSNSRIKFLDGFQFLFKILPVKFKNQNVEFEIIYASITLKASFCLVSRKFMLILIKNLAKTDKVWRVLNGLKFRLWLPSLYSLEFGYRDTFASLGQVTIEQKPSDKKNRRYKRINIVNPMPRVFGHWRKLNNK